MNRRRFLHTAAILAAPAVASARLDEPPPSEPVIMTVLGPVAPQQLGFTLPHEHLLVDFIGAEQASPLRYNADEVIATARPFLNAARQAGCRTLVECTPAFLGRDPALLARLSRECGLHVLTNTGYYNANGGRHLPDHARIDSANDLADRWIHEARDGMEGTPIRPGFIKIGVDAGPLSPDSEKLLRAAARTHRITGLTTMAHTGDATAARQQLALLADLGVHPSAWIWAHAQSATPGDWLPLARKGAWIELDNAGPDNLQTLALHLRTFRDANLLSRLLLSHDAGWYHVGEPDGGTFLPFTPLLLEFPTICLDAGIAQADLDRIRIDNPRDAFTTARRLA